MVANLSTLLISAMLLYLGHADTALRVLGTLFIHTAVYAALYWSGSVRLGAHLFMLVIFAEITWDYGQDDGYSVLATILLPLGASAILGTRGAILWTLIGITWAGWLGPFVLRVGDFSIPMSLTAACMTVVVGFAAYAIEANRAGAMRQAASAKARLREREEALRDFIDTTFPAHIQTATNGIVRASPEAAELLGESVEELQTKKLMDLVHPEDQQTVLTKFTGASTSGFRDEVRLRKKDGSWVWVEGFGVPLQSLDGQEPDDVPWVFAARDIEDERRERENWQRAQRLEGVGILAAGVAHDFNNLLTVIRGFTELMPKSEEQVNVLSAADKASELTASLMRFGRVAPKASDVVDLVAALRKWQPMFISLLGEDCEFELVAPSDEALVSVSESQLNQVLLNLVTNAKEAMPEGGRLRICVSNEVVDAELAQVRGISTGRYVRISVRDSGVGMDKFVREHAFDPFYTTKQMGQGSGLGLASVYGIVQQQHGAIEIDSVPSRGTEFTIWLPEGERPLDSSGPDTGVARTPSVALSSGRVLLVEDSADIRAWVERALTERGFEVTCSESGDRALDVLEHEQPDLLITDIVMSGMRGTELAKAARERYPDLGILFMSGYADTGVNDWRLAARNRSRFLAKPFGTAELVREAQALLSAPLRPA